MKTALIAAVLVIISPLAVNAYVEYGAWYQGPAPYYQQYYQPMYASAYAPSQNTTIYQPNYQSQPQFLSMSYPQYGYQNYGYGGYQNYSYYPQNYGGYGYQAQPSPVHPGYRTGETMPWLGGELCTFPGYEGRAICGSNPRQYVYDHWTGTWY